MNRLLAFAVIIPLILCSCTSIQDAEKVSLSAETAAPPVDEASSSPSALHEPEEIIDQPDADDPLMEEYADLLDELIAKLEAQDEGLSAVSDMLFADFDGDGIPDLYTHMTSEVEGVGTSVWYVSVNCDPILLVEPGPRRYQMSALTSGGSTFAVMDREEGRKLISYVFAIDKNGIPYHAPISNKGWVLPEENEHGEIELIVTYHVDSPGGGGYYQDATYFFYVEEGLIYEYGVIEVDVDQFRQFAGARVVFEDLSEDASNFRVLYQDNDIFQLLYELDGVNENYGQRFVTFRYYRQELQEIERGSVWYTSALVPEIATYPTGFPEQ